MVRLAIPVRWSLQILYILGSDHRVNEDRIVVKMEARTQRTAERHEDHQEEQDSGFHAPTSLAKSRLQTPTNTAS